jgi:hypothetical protein
MSLNNSPLFRHRADADARVIPPTRRNLHLGAAPVHSAARRQDRTGRHHHEARHDVLAVAATARDAPVERNNCFDLAWPTMTLNTNRPKH